MESADESTPLIKDSTAINRDVTNSEDIEADSPPNHEIRQSKKVSWIAGALIITNVATGSGLLNYPHATQQAGGILNVILLQLILVTLAQGGMILILYCSIIANEKNLPDIVRYFAGNTAAKFANIFLIIHDYGSCIIYLVVLGDQLDSVMSKIYNDTWCHYWYMNRNFTLSAVTVVFILPVILRKSVRSMLLGSVLGVFTIYYLLGLVVYKFYAMRNGVDSPEEYSQVRHPTLDSRQENILWYSAPHYAIFKAVPAIVFSFQAHIEAIPIFADFKKRTILESIKAIGLETMICLGVYNTVGIYGYLTFGLEVKSDILSNYVPVDIPVLVAIALFGLKCSTAYPIAFFCPRLVIYDVFGDACRLNRLSERARRVLVTIFMFILSIVFALYVPTIGAIISLLGGSAALFMFVFPGLCFMQHHMSRGDWKHELKRYIGAFYIVVGVFISSATYIQSIISFVHGEGNEREVVCYPLNDNLTYPYSHTTKTLLFESMLN